MSEVERTRSDLRSRYTGFDKLQAVPVRLSELEDLDFRLASGLPVELPESTIREGLRIRKVIETMSRTVRERLPGGEFGSSRVPAIEDMTRQLLADFYIEKSVEEGDPMIWLAGEKVLPISDDGGTAGDRARATQ